MKSALVQTAKKLLGPAALTLAVSPFATPAFADDSVTAIPQGKYGMAYELRGGDKVKGTVFVRCEKGAPVLLYARTSEGSYLQTGIREGGSEYVARGRTSNENGVFYNSSHVSMEPSPLRGLVGLCEGKVPTRKQVSQNNKLNRIVREILQNVH